MVRIAGKTFQLVQSCYILLRQQPNHTKNQKTSCGQPRPSKIKLQFLWKYKMPEIRVDINISRIVTKCLPDIIGTNKSYL